MISKNISDNTLQEVLVHLHHYNALDNMNLKICISAFIVLSQCQLIQVALTIFKSY